jgi:hypothetical protein
LIFLLKRAVKNLNFIKRKKSDWEGNGHVNIILKTFQVNSHLSIYVSA